MIHVIGGAGFVGTRLSKVLKNAHRDYQIFDKTLKGNSFCDVTNPSSLAHIPPADVMINLAAEHRDDVTPRSLYDEVNVEGAKNVCNICREKNIKTIVFTSSVAVYGFAPEGTTEDGEYNPFNDYGRTKMEAEAVYREWLSESPRERSLVIIRPAVIFGEQNRGNVHSLFRQIAIRRFIMFGSGTNRKSMAYVQNVAEFIAFSTTLGAGEHLYNYVDKPDFDMNTLVTHCRSVLFGKENVGPRIPGWLGITVGYLFDMLAVITGSKPPISSIRVKKFMRGTAFNSSVLKTGFVPSYRLEVGLTRTLQYEFLKDYSGDEKSYSE